MEPTIKRPWRTWQTRGHRQLLRGRHPQKWTALVLESFWDSLEMWGRTLCQDCRKKSATPAEMISMLVTADQIGDELLSKEPTITEASLEIILAFKLKNKTENVFIQFRMQLFLWSHDFNKLNFKMTARPLPVILPKYTGVTITQPKKIMLMYKSFFLIFKKK
jgi:hypothetical protein